jgi:hypothetical protein
LLPEPPKLPLPPTDLTRPDLPLSGHQLPNQLPLLLLPLLLPLPLLLVFRPIRPTG